MPVGFLTNEQLAEHQALEREIMRRRGGRVLAADQAKSAAKANPPPAPQPNAPKVDVVDGATAAKLSEKQAREMAEAYRANYAEHYAGDPEIIALMEARLAAAAKADGWELPPLSPTDRLRLLRQRHAAKGI
jgi:hypothetical protein